MPDKMRTIPRKLPRVFLNAEIFYWIRLFLPAAFASFALACLTLYILALFRDDLLRMSEDVRYVLILAGVFTAPLIPFVLLFLRFFGKGRSGGVLRLISHAGRSGFELASPLLTRNMNAADAETVFEVLERRLKYAVTDSALAQASGTCLRPCIIGFMTGMLLLFLPLENGKIVPETKLERCREMILGKEWETYLPLKIIAQSPEDGRIRRNSNWFLRIEFNRPLKGKEAYVRFPADGGEKALRIPLQRVRDNIYQASMPPLTEDGSCRVFAEGCSGGRIRIFPFRSEIPELSEVTLKYGSLVRRFKQDIPKRFTVAPGETVELLLQMKSPVESIALAGSGDLHGMFRHMPGTNYWVCRFSAWESGAFSWRWRMTDGSGGASEVFDIELILDVPPEVHFVKPAPLEALCRPVSFRVSGEDDFGIAKLGLFVNNLHGTDFQDIYEEKNKSAKKISHDFRLSPEREARLTGNIVAIVLAAKDVSLQENIIFQGPFFHPVVFESENELLDRQEIIQLFKDWLEQSEPPPPLPTPENKEQKDKPENKDQKDKPENKDQKSGSKDEKNKFDNKDQKDKPENKDQKSGSKDEKDKFDNKDQKDKPENKDQKPKKSDCSEDGGGSSSNGGGSESGGQSQSGGSGKDGSSSSDNGSSSGGETSQNGGASSKGNSTGNGNASGGSSGEEGNQAQGASSSDTSPNENSGHGKNQSGTSDASDSPGESVWKNAEGNENGTSPNNDGPSGKTAETSGLSGENAAGSFIKPSSGNRDPENGKPEPFANSGMGEKAVAGDGERSGNEVVPDQKEPSGSMPEKRIAPDGKPPEPIPELDLNLKWRDRELYDSGKINFSGELKGDGIPAGVDVPLGKFEIRPARTPVSENISRSAFEKEFERYRVVRERLSPAERRIADDYYSRLRTILSGD